MTSQHQHGWDFILNWMSDRMRQKEKNNNLKHGDTDAEYGDEDTQHKESIDDEKVSLVYVDEKDDTIEQLDVKELSARLTGLCSQEQKYTEL